MKLTALKSRLTSIGHRLTEANTPEVQRLRGSAAVKRRATFLSRNPLCEWCDRHDKVAAATVPDHRIPLWAGGSDDLDTNGNALCAADHDAKTACEARMRAAGGWLATPCECGQHENAAPRPA